MNKPQQSQQSQPKPQKVVRKLSISKEKVAQLNEAVENRYCTKRQTGCPVHTC